MATKKSIPGDAGHDFIARVKELYDSGIRYKVGRARLRRATQTFRLVTSLSNKHHTCLDISRLREIIAGTYVPTKRDIENLAYDFALNKSNDPSALSDFIQLGRDYLTHCEQRAETVAKQAAEEMAANSNNTQATEKPPEEISFGEQLKSLRKSRTFFAREIFVPGGPQKGDLLTRSDLQYISAVSIRIINDLEAGKCFADQPKKSRTNWKSELEYLLKMMKATPDERKNIIEAFDKGSAQAKAEREKPLSNGEEKIPFVDRISRGDIQIG